MKNWMLSCNHHLIIYMPVFRWYLQPQNAFNRQGNSITCRYVIPRYQLIEKQSNIQLQKAPYHIVRMPIHSEAMLRNHRFDLTAVTHAKSKQSELHYKSQSTRSSYNCCVCNTLIKRPQFDNYHNPFFLPYHYIVLGMRRDVKVMKACLNSGRTEKKYQWLHWD